MCGYCMEQGALIPFLAIEYSQDLALIEHYLSEWQDRQIISLFLPDTDHVNLLLSSVRDTESITLGIDIVFCRLYEYFIFSGYSLSIYTSLMSYCDKSVVDSFYTRQFDRAALDSFYSRQCKIDSETPIKVLWKEETFATQNNWNSFISDKQLLTGSHVKLEAYHDWWILGHGKEKNDPDTQIRELGHYTDEDNPTRGDWRRFSLEFPSIFFSFCYVAKYSPQSDIIKRIALDGLPNVPSLSFACDLWLQRKAFLHCVKEGIRDSLHSGTC